VTPPPPPLPPPPDAGAASATAGLPLTDAGATPPHRLRSADPARNSSVIAEASSARRARKALIFWRT
jgi:hypothetical protein